MDDAPAAHRAPAVDNAALRALALPTAAPFAHMTIAFNQLRENRNTATTKHR